MHRFLEFIFGLDRGFLGREGEFSVQFNPRWPLQDLVGAITWNLLLGALAVALVIYVYRRESRSRFSRLLLGGVRLALLLFIIALLNRPVFRLTQSRTEPSVLAVVMDDSLSMTVRDAGVGGDGQGTSRWQSVINLLDGDNQRLLKDLTSKHTVKLYTFDSDARPVGTITKDGFVAPSGSAPSTRPAAATEVFGTIRPEGKSTQILASMRSVLDDLQGQRLAGVVLLTDGRDTPAESVADVLPVVRNFGVKVYPIAVGSEKPPQNITVEGVDMEDAAFAKDIVSTKVHVRATGYSPGHTVKVVLKNKTTGQPLLRADGKPAEATVAMSGDAAQDVEINFKPSDRDIGTLDLVAEAQKQPGEVNEEDNVFPGQIQILDSKIAVLFVDGYPRWDYRYLKTALIRDQTVDVSCLLLSADSGFAQEGDPPHGTFPGPITRFPESMTELLAYDVVLFGDVDPRQFTDAQLQLVHDFVLKKNGGFGMVAGPKWSPAAYRNTPIEPVLPVNITRAQSEETLGNVTLGYRPVLTKTGENSTIFRFFEDKAQNARYLKEDWQPMFWYAHGITTKPNVGEVYAEHGSELGPDGKKAPLLVLGRFGGRTAFAAYDDSWRWRFYTGESIFDTYWVQMIRYLAREKKLGQRRFTLTSLRPAYELGQSVEVQLRVLDPDLLRQLPEQIGVIITQKAPNGAEQAVRQETFQRKENDRELYVASWTADKVGQFSLKLPALGGATSETEMPVVVKIPRLELVQPQVDRDLLSRLSQRDEADASGPDLAKLVLAGPGTADVVRSELGKISSAAMIQLIPTDEPLWNAPLALLIFVLLITAEWVLRKVYGML